MWPADPSPPYFASMSLKRQSPGLRLLVTCAASLAGLVGVAAPTAAQSSLIVESRVGVSIPTGSFAVGPGGGRLAEAPTLGVRFGLLQGGRTYVTLGFAQVRTDCSRDGCGSRWVSTQWEAGVLVDLARGPAIPWLRAGLVSPTVENVPIRQEPGGALATGTSERGWGGELGAGVRFELSERLSLSPGARWVSVDVGRAAEDDLAMRYWVVDVGIVVGF